MTVDATTVSAGPTRIVRTAVVLGPATLALLLAIVRSDQIPMWRDEFATAMFASMSPAELFSATSHVDAVIAPYYLLMHALSPLLGLGLGMRTVSILAFATTAGLVAAIAGRWWGPLGGAAAGLAMALNGEALSAAVNARPYALSLSLAAAGILLADQAIRSGRTWAWIGYATTAAAAIALQLFAVLAVGSIGVLLARRSGSTVIRWCLASVPALATAVAVVLVGLNHRGQLDWLGVPAVRDAILGIARTSGVSADRAVVLDALALSILLMAGALAIVASRQKRTSSGLTDAVRTRVFSLILTLAPPVLLFAVSWIITPVFTGKYFIWSSLGAALILGGTVVLLRPPRRWVGVVAGVMAAALLVLAVVVTGIRFLDPPPHGDDFPAAVRTLESDAAIGDALVIAQPYAFGGVAYGFAVSAGDVSHAREIAGRAVTGSQPVLDSRSITSVQPLRTVAGTAGSEPTNPTWVITIFPLTDAQLATVDPALGACLRTIDFESPTERYGALRLFRLPCD